jgi:hypothetical protein
MPYYRHGNQASPAPARSDPARQADRRYREVNRLRSHHNAATTTRRAELDQVDRRIRRIVELITDEDAPVRALKQELVTLEARQLTLQRELAGAAAPEPLLHPNLAELYRQRVEALRDDGTRDEAFELIRSLIDEIRLVPEDNQLRLELRGELAGILALAAGQKEARRPFGDRACTANQDGCGARNHLYRTTLALMIGSRRSRDSA